MTQAQLVYLRFYQNVYEQQIQSHSSWVCMEGQPSLQTPCLSTHNANNASMHLYMFNMLLSSLFSRVCYCHCGSVLWLRDCFVLLSQLLNDRLRGRDHSASSPSLTMSTQLYLMSYLKETLNIIIMNMKSHTTVKLACNVGIFRGSSTAQILILILLCQNKSLWQSI